MHHGRLPLFPPNPQSLTPPLPPKKNSGTTSQSVLCELLKAWGKDGLDKHLRGLQVRRPSVGWFRMDGCIGGCVLILG